MNPLGLKKICCVVKKEKKAFFPDALYTPLSWRQYAFLVPEIKNRLFGQTFIVQHAPLCACEQAAYTQEIHFPNIQQEKKTFFKKKERTIAEKTQRQSFFSSFRTSIQSSEKVVARESEGFLEETPKKLGIIAGSGALPGALIQHCLETKRPFFVLALKGHAEIEQLPTGIPICWIRPGAVGKGFHLLKKQGVEEIVLIGAVRRPSIAELCPDLRGMAFFARLGFKVLGDDSLLRAVVQEIESEGFKVRGIHELMPHLLMPVGILGRVSPEKNDWTDIARGVKTAHLLGEADVGQSVIVQQGIVLSVEGIEGTKALIERTKPLKRKGEGGVLVKMVKPGQEKRADLPTIGPETVQSVYEAGLKGIAAEADGVLIVEGETMIQKADALGIFIVGVENGEK